MSKNSQENNAKSEQNGRLTQLHLKVTISCNNLITTVFLQK
jgi:hypothetical protein